MKALVDAIQKDLDFQQKEMTGFGHYVVHTKSAGDIAKTVLHTLRIDEFIVALESGDVGLMEEIMDLWRSE